MANEDSEQKHFEQKGLASRSSDLSRRNSSLGVSFIVDLPVCKVAVL